MHSPDDSVRLSRGQWMVLVAAFLGWLFDGFEIGLFPVVARPALLSMIENGKDADVGDWMGIVTACFLLGAAAGGMIFGWLGDRIGRVRALAASILTYSLFTGLGYFAQLPWHLGATRFLAALGMGGEWALGVALVMECWPEKWRPTLAGLIGAAANCGFFLVGVVAKAKSVTPESWRWVFLVGALPAVLVFFILLFVPESQRWKKSVASSASKPVREIIASGLLPRALLGVLLASVALIGTWGSVQWVPLWADKLAGAANPGAKADAQLWQGVGAILGCLIAPQIGAWLGRRVAYFLLCLGSVIVCAVFFRTITEYGALFLFMSFLTSAITASFYGWFPLYLPELFPTRVRATGQGLCYNFGRVFAAVGAVTQGQLVRHFEGSYAKAGAVVTLVYLIGMAIIWLAPETKGKPLPE
ncbi:MAG TPA: MFS transporter [Verrucomicrobiae bacterium]|nr:MFS transporter [Verrucomicrobiae bacterium]